MIASHSRLERLPSAALRLLAVVALVLAGLAAMPAARADYPGPALVFNADTGEVLAAERALDPWYPASTTKLMTIYVAFEAVRAGLLTFDSPVTISRHAANQPPSRSGLAVGTTLRLQTALEILMVKSANDVAIAVAEAVGGSQAGFSRLMNAAAARLGMTASTFVNPHGLPDSGHISTARDLGLLAQALWRDFPEWRGFFTIESVQLGRSTWRNHNPLITRYPGAIGFKTGFICASGFNLVTGASRDGTTLIAIVLGARSGLERGVVAKHLLDRGFSRNGSMFAGHGPTLAAYTQGRAPAAAPEDMRARVCRQPRERPTAEQLVAAYGAAYRADTYAPARGSNARDEIFAAVDAGEDDGNDQLGVLDMLLGPVLRRSEPRVLTTGGTVGTAAAARGQYAPPAPVSRDMALAGLAPAAGPSSEPAATPAQAAPVQAAPPAAQPRPHRAVPAPALRHSIMGE